jgi:hypothetical protein
MKRKSSVAVLFALAFLLLGFVGGAFATFGFAATQGDRTGAAYLQTEMYRFYDAYTLAQIRDSRSQKLADTVVARVQFRTLKIAKQFDQLTPDQRRDALHMFASLDKIPSIRSDQSQLGKNAARARAEVEKTHAAIRDAGVNLSGD